MRRFLLLMAMIVVTAACPACHDGDCGAGGGAGSGGMGQGGSPGASLAESYCDCMLLTCHDAYHDAFGPESDEEAARAACLAEAEALPVAGMDVDTGNFVECRIHHCTSGMSDPATCAAAIGEGACSP